LTQLFVTIDQGNSKLKACAWEALGDGIRLRAKQSFQGPGADVPVREWVVSLGGHALAAMSSVAAPAARGDLQRALGEVAEFLQPGPGLKNRCEPPQGVGQDRLFAARGALALAQQGCVVVDAGTALTVDAVTLTAGGSFLGGSIAPGPELLAEVLALRAAQLPQVQAAPGVPAVGLNTEQAIRSGVAHGLRGAASELAVRVAEEVGLVGAPVLLTGGARAFLLEPEPVFLAPCRVEPELVHLGLLAAAGWPTTCP